MRRPVSSALEGVLRELLSGDSVVRGGEPLARRTTLRVGGAAECYVEPAGEEDLALLLRFCREREVPFFLLGRGSNLLVQDGGIHGVVICLEQPAFAQVVIDGDRLRCGAGARLKTLAVEARRAGLAGFEFLEGIPGSVGGALRMNAGAMGSWTFDLVERVRAMDLDGQIVDKPRAEVEVGYRGCPFLAGRVALAAVFRGQPLGRREIEARGREYNERRWNSQPAEPSAGCIFKNPAVMPAGRLIDELGLKGTRVGGAVVSEVHANFIVNEGQATAADILALIELIRTRAREARGIELETEVQIVGEAAAAKGGGR